MLVRREEIEVKNIAKTGMRCKDGKLTHEAVYENGTVIAVPLNLGGEMKWFDDSKLIKKDLIKDKAEKYLLNSNGKDIRICVLSHKDSTNYICSKSKIINAKVDLNNFLTISDPEDEEILTHIPYVNLLNVTINVLCEVIITYKYASYQIEVCLPYSAML